MFFRPDPRFDPLPECLLRGVLIKVLIKMVLRMRMADTRLPWSCVSVEREMLSCMRNLMVQQGGW